MPVGQAAGEAQCRPKVPAMHKVSPRSSSISSSDYESSDQEAEQHDQACNQACKEGPVVFLSDMHLRSLLEPQDTLFTDEDFLKMFKQQQRELSTENTDTKQDGGWGTQVELRSDCCRAATSADMLRSQPACTAHMNTDDLDASEALNQAELASAIGCGDKLQRVWSADGLQKEFWNADGEDIEFEFHLRDRGTETPSTTQTPSRPQPDSGGWASALGHQLALAAVSAAAAAVSPVKPAGKRESKRGGITMAGIAGRRPRRDVGSEGQEEAARRSCNGIINQQQQQVQPQVPATEGPETLAIPTPGRETLQKQRHTVQLDALSGVRGVWGDLINHPVSPGAALARTGEREYTWQVLPAGGCVTTLKDSIKVIGVLLGLY